MNEKDLLSKFERIFERFDKVESKLEDITKTIHYNGGIDTRLEKLESTTSKNKESKDKLKWILITACCSSPVVSLLLKFIGVL